MTGQVTLKKQLAAFSATSSSLRGTALKIHPVIYLHSASPATLCYPALLCTVFLAVFQIVTRACHHNEMHTIAGYTYTLAYKQNCTCGKYQKGSVDHRSQLS